MQVADDRPRFIDLLHKLPWSQSLHSHADLREQIYAASYISHMDVCSQEFTQDSLKKVVAGLIYMLSGRGGGADSVRAVAQFRAAQALSWMCFNPEAPDLIMERGLKTLIAVITSDSLDRNVLVETIALCGWLALSGDDKAFQLGATSEVRHQSESRLSGHGKQIEYRSGRASQLRALKLRGGCGRRRLSPAADLAGPNRRAGLQHPDPSGSGPNPDLLFRACARAPLSARRRRSRPAGPHHQHPRSRARGRADVIA